MSAYMVIEGVRRRIDFDGLETKQKDERRLQDAIKGSAMLRDAILIAKGLTPPAIKREPRPFPKTEAEAGCAPACPVCKSPIKPEFQFISHIQQTVASYFGVDHKSMVSAERRTEVAHPRQMAMFLACELTHKPYTEIGRRFARDHTTVIHAERVVKKRIRDNPEWELDAEVLRGELTA